MFNDAFLSALAFVAFMAISTLIVAWVLYKVTDNANNNKR